MKMIKLTTYYIIILMFVFSCSSVDTFKATIDGKTIELSEPKLISFYFESENKASEYFNIVDRIKQYRYEQKEAQNKLDSRTGMQYDLSTWNAYVGHYVTKIKRLKNQKFSLINNYALKIYASFNSNGIYLLNYNPNDPFTEIKFNDVKNLKIGVNYKVFRFQKINSNNSKFGYISYYLPWKFSSDRINKNQFYIMGNYNKNEIRFINY